MKLKLNQAIDFDGGDIDKSCVLGALNDLQTELKSINNSNQKSIGGGGEDSVSCPICAENIPSSSAVCPICAEPLLTITPSATNTSIDDTLGVIGTSTLAAVDAQANIVAHMAPDNPAGFTGENTMGEVLEELKKINKNLSLIAKHLLFD